MPRRWNASASAVAHAGVSAGGWRDVGCVRGGNCWRCTLVVDRRRSSRSSAMRAWRSARPGRVRRRVGRGRAAPVRDRWIGCGGAAAAGGRATAAAQRGRGEQRAESAGDPVATGPDADARDPRPGRGPDSAGRHADAQSWHADPEPETHRRAPIHPSCSRRARSRVAVPERSRPDIGPAGWPVTRRPYRSGCAGDHSSARYADGSLLARKGGNGGVPDGAGGRCVVVADDSASGVTTHRSGRDGRLSPWMDRPGCGTPASSCR